MSENDGNRAVRQRVGAQAKRRMAAPLLAAGMPHATIAELLRTSTASVSRWASESAVRDDVAAVAETGRKAGEDRIAELVRGAFDALADSLTSDDGRVKLDAARTVLDRFGYPVASKAEVTGRDGSPVGLPVVAVAYETLRALAREEGE